MDKKTLAIALAMTALSPKVDHMHSEAAFSIIAICGQLVAVACPMPAVVQGCIEAPTLLVNAGPLSFEPDLAAGCSLGAAPQNVVQQAEVDKIGNLLLGF